MSDGVSNLMPSGSREVPTVQETDSRLSPDERMTAPCSCQSCLGERCVLLRLSQ